MSYNVLYEKWIPVSDGYMYSLWECLEHAHELERVSCTSPLETYAVHRFLCTFVMDALQLPNKKARMELLRQGCFDMAAFDAYIKQCEAEGVSFDLFDEKRPFMQAEADAELDGSDKPVAVIVPDVPSGNNHVFLEHRMADEHVLTAESAWRNLLEGYVFCTAGAQGYPSSVNNTPCLYVIVHGRTLFETLMLGCVSCKETGNLPYGKPPWRCFEPIVPKKEYASVDLLEGMEWQPRRARLVEDYDGLIRRVHYVQGKSFKGNDLWRDPHVPYRLLKDGTYSSIKPSSGRSLWRDLGGMAVSRGDRYGKQPQVIASLPDELSICRITVIGLITNQATLVDTVCEEMIIPTAILNDEDKGEVLHSDLDFVEAVNRQIGKAFGDRVPTALAEDLKNAFLASIRDFIFGQYFERLEPCQTDEDYQNLKELVDDQVLACLRSMFVRLSLRLGHDARNIVLQASVQQHIMNGYNKLRRERNDG